MNINEFENCEVIKDKENRVVSVELFYPKVKNHINTVEVDLCDVRATDGIRIQYSHERNGWVIYQPKTTHPFIEEKGGIKYHGMETEWIESSFCPSWKFDEEKEEC